MKLIARVYETQKGSVRIAGLDARRIPLAELRSEVSYIPQRAAVFSGSIKTI